MNNLVNYTDIIKHPILTEKTYKQMNFENTYTFAVAQTANKTIVKEAITKLFDVKVESVNIMNTKKQPKRMGKYAGFKKAYKKAIVKLAPGQQLGNPNDNTDVKAAAPKKEAAPKVEAPKAAAPAKIAATKTATAAKPAVAQKSTNRGK